MRGQIFDDSPADSGSIGQEAAEIWTAQADLQPILHKSDRLLMFVVDTNVLIYAADQDSEFHQPCRARLEQWRRQTSPWYLTWSICYEFLRVSTHPKVFRKPFAVTAARQFLDAVLASPSACVLLATERHAGVLRETLGELPQLRGNILHDAHTAVLMREHGIQRIVTRDTDFHRFPFVNVVDPLTA